MGTATSGVEVTNVSGHGFWVLVDGRELLLPFDEFPWFRDATIAEITELERPRPEHLRWPRLDIDLTIDSIEHPDRYPMSDHRSVNERRATPGPNHTD